METMQERAEIASFWTRVAAIPEEHLQRAADEVYDGHLDPEETVAARVERLLQMAEDYASRPPLTPEELAFIDRDMTTEEEAELSTSLHQWAAEHVRKLDEQETKAQEKP